MSHMRDFEPVLPNPQPYIERALALYDRTVREKRGCVVFIAAELGGGKTEVLGAIAKALHEAQPAPNFIAGYFSRGEYKPYTLHWRENICLRKSLVAMGRISSLLGLLPLQFASVAALIGQAIETYDDVREFAGEFKQGPQKREEYADQLKTKLRRAAELRPLVCLLDDWDEAQRFSWDSMLFTFAREVARDLPILLFITVKEPINLNASDKGESQLTEVIKSLIDKGLAELWTLKKLSREEVAAAIGQAAPGIAEKLHGVTGGNARWVSELWHEWRLNEIVIMNKAGHWVWSGNRETTMNLYKDILEDRLKRILKNQAVMELERTREVLACAALEGAQFTVDAVALALGWDQDELIDFLDESLIQTEDNPDGLLLEDDSITITMPKGVMRTLWRYNFISNLHLMALERYGFADQRRPGNGASEKLEKSAALAEALMETYAPEERLVAAPLARLLREVGSTEAAKHYQQMADYAARREVMRGQALNLLVINKDDWEQWQCRSTAEFLIVAGRSMMNSFPHYETLSVFEEAYILARRAKDKYHEAMAQYYRGSILYLEGDYKSARAKANDALNMILLLIRKQIEESATLLLLARIDVAEGRYADARERLVRVLTIIQKVGDRQGEITSLQLLAEMDRAESKHDDARERTMRALAVAQEIGDREGEALSLQILARVDYSEGKYADARERAMQALTVAQEIGSRQGEGASLSSLAEIDYLEDKYGDARERTEQALKIQQEIGDRRGEGTSLYSLARVDYAEGKYADARERAIRALAVAQEIGSRHAEAASLRLLSGVANKSGLKREAFILISFSLLILNQLGHVDAKTIEGELVDLKAENKYTDVQERELNNEISEAYRKDGSKDLVETALGKVARVVL